MIVVTPTREELARRSGYAAWLCSIVDRGCMRLECDQVRDGFCVYCGRPVETPIRTRRRLYCSDPCRLKVSYQRRGPERKPPGYWTEYYRKNRARRDAQTAAYRKRRRLRARLCEGGGGEA